jgi:hypothetical protein
MRLFDELKRAHSLGTPNASKLYGIFILPLAQDGFERALRCGRDEGPHSPIYIEPFPK